MPGETYSGPSIDLLKSLPPEAYQTIPFGPPPPGVEPNFEDPTTRVPVVLGVSITYLVITTIGLGLRAHAKVSIVKRWKWDDTLVFLGYALSIVYFSGVVFRCIGGAAGRHEWDVHLDKALGRASLLQSYVCTIMVTPALGLIKMSLFVQYYHLFSVMRYVQISVYTIGSATAIFYFSVSITAFDLNSPWPGESLLDAILSWHYLKFAKFSIPNGVIGMLVDWSLLLLPMPAVWRLKISRRRKLGVILIFITGALGAVASVVSLYYRVLLQVDPTDTTWKVGYVLLWTQLEMWSGVTASCMPSIKQVFSHYISSPSGNTTSSSSGPGFRHAKPKSTPKSGGTFKMWGYRSHAETESTANITQNSAGVTLDELNRDGAIVV